MNLIATKEKMPDIGEFVHVKADTEGWEHRIVEMARRGQQMWFSIFDIPVRSEYLENALKRLGYRRLMYNEDRWLRFLVKDLP